MHDALQLQPSFEQLTPILTELREMAQQYEQILQQRRQQRKPSVYTPDQQQKIRRSLGKVVSFD